MYTDSVRICKDVKDCLYRGNTGTRRDIYGLYRGMWGCMRIVYAYVGKSKIK